MSSEQQQPLMQENNGKNSEWDTMVAEAEVSDRLGFIQKVYGILSVQLLFTCAFVYAVLQSPDIQHMIMTPALCGTVLVLYIMSACALICCRMDRAVPLNYILLTVFTVCVSYIVSITCLRYNKVLVLEAAIMTATLFVALTAYALTTKQDFTVCGPIMFIVGAVLVSSILLMSLFGYTQNLLFCMLGVFVFSFYIVCDTQMIIGGKHKRNQFSLDMYVLASVVLYLDIIDLFLQILQALND